MKTHISELSQALQRRTLALFIGADLPRAVTGLPSRADLAHELARRKGRARSHVDESLSLAEVAQRVSRAGNRWEFTAFIRDALDTAKSPQPFHQRIVALVQAHPIETLITTAYDNLLELSFQEAGIGINRVVRGSDVAFIRPDRPTLIKLYGDAQQPDTLVVTDRDHSNLLRDRDKEALVDEVRRTLRRNTVLFIGYNLADADFRFLFDQIAESRFARTAYAVWPGLPKADVEMWRDRGIVILDTDPLGILGESDTLSAPPFRPEPTVTMAPSPPRTGESKMDHERGLDALGAQLEQTNRYLEFTTLEARLRENLHDERLYGSTETIRSERARIINSLNKLTLEVLGLSFNDLALGRVSAAGQTSARELSLVRQLDVTPSPVGIKPPVQARLQDLPFNELSWEQFESLCTALIEAQPVSVDCHLYGVQGDDQRGIDIVATQRGATGNETWAYQCKRYKEYTPGKLKEALAKMAYPADYYVLMLSIPARAALRQVAEQEPNVFLWDADDIARKLKNYPAIVEDFFGGAWREAFC